MSSSQGLLSNGNQAAAEAANDTLNQAVAGAAENDEEGEASAEQP